MTKPEQLAIQQHYKEIDNPLEIEVLHEVFEDFIGQRSWTTTSDFRNAAELLKLSPGMCLLDYGCGFGGPTLFLAELTGCRCVGFDINRLAISTANKHAAEKGFGDTVRFVEDVTEICHASMIFDAVLMNDSVCHIPNRQAVYRTCYESLRPLGRILITDPLVETGILTESEKMLRAPNIFYEFTKVGDNEHALESAGFNLLMKANSTHRLVELTDRYLKAYRARQGAFETQMRTERYHIMIQQLELVHDTAVSDRLSRFTYLAERQV
jgi:2-polyprenyl-3-methyl-5-hydroxy-6-metoxy-1,4-benzoquinol methylase